MVISTLSAGGAERILCLMANYWARKGWDVKILNFDDRLKGPFFELDSNIGHIALGISGNSSNMLVGFLKNIERIWILRRHIRQYGPEAVISFVDKTNIITLAATWRLNIKVLVSERTDPHVYSIGKTWCLLRRFLYQRADWIVVQTERASRYFLPRFRKTTIVIPNPVSITGAKQSISKKNEHQKMIIGMGRLSKEKGFDDLLRAFAIVKDRYPDWSVTILGEGSQREALESLCHELKLTGRVFFPGLVKVPEVYLRSAGLFVLSSRFEGFPNALCEAMACGCAVIATDCHSGPREVIRDGENGMLVPAYDIIAMAAAIDRLIANPCERARLGQSALNISEVYGIDTIMSLWERALESTA